MNIFMRILLLSSLSSMMINGQSNEPDIDQIMDEFQVSLVTLYIVDSKSSLNGIMGYFDADEQELCYVSSCVVKENGVNNVREYLKSLKGVYDESQIEEWDVEVLSNDNHLGYVLLVNYKEYNTVDECSGYITGQYIFILNSSGSITKWVMVERDSTDYENCDDDNSDLFVPSTTI